MDIEKIFSETGIFDHLKMDYILVESKYPILFTCKDGPSVYMFICCLVDAKSVQWIGTKTTYDTRIALLTDKITIREAFLRDFTEKLMIEYHGAAKKPTAETVNKNEISEQLLPPKGEFMEAEEGEFDTEIEAFKERNTVREMKVALSRLRKTVKQVSEAY